MVEAAFPSPSPWPSPSGRGCTISSARSYCQRMVFQRAGDGPPSPEGEGRGEWEVRIGRQKVVVLTRWALDWGVHLILPPERGHSCPQRAPSAHRFTYVLKPFLPRTLLRTGMSALRIGGSIKMHPG